MPSATIAGLTSTALWTAAMALLLAGTFQPFESNRLVYFAWSVFMAFIALACTMWLLVEHVVKRETGRASMCIADSVGVALGRHLSNRGGNLTSLRRGD